MNLLCSCELVSQSAPRKSTNRQLEKLNENFFVQLHQVMLNQPDRVLLDLADRSPLTYGEANRLSAQLANHLRSLGLESGNRITIQCEKSYKAVILYLACLRSGIIFHPLNTGYTLNELQYFLKDAEPTLVVCESSRRPATNDLARSAGIRHVLTLQDDGENSLWADIDQYSENFLPIFRDKDDLALLIYTSGTTGKPKGAMITHENISSNAASLVDIWHWRSDDILLHILPLFHVHGLCVGLHCPMLLGCRIIFHNQFSVRETLQWIPKSTVLMAVPTIYTRLLRNSELTKHLCRSMRLFISGSAPLLPETFEEFERKTGHAILERYGMTEAQMITSNPMEGERIPGTVGHALPDIGLRITERDGTALEVGQTGILEIKGANVFSGYWRKPEATQKVFRKDGYFITGDFAAIDECNRVTIVGRDSDLIISAGLNVYPREVEIALNNLPWVIDSAAFGVPHPDLGEAVVAVVIQRTDHKSMVDITAGLNNHLSKFKIPKQIIFVEEFPRNAMGKIQKNQLRRDYRSLFVGQ